MFERMGSNPPEIAKFGDRLRDTLAARGPEATRAWLAERSGVDPSLISRIVSNRRVPTLETIQVLAAALEVDPAVLVSGTDAETRLSDGPDLVRRSDYAEAISKLIEFEARARDFEARNRSLTETLEKERNARRRAEDDRSRAETERDELASLVDESKVVHQTQQHELDRYKAALERAFTQFSAMRARVDDLQRELGETKQSSKASAILSGVAAIAGVATVAMFLGGDDSPAKKSRTRSIAKKKTGGTH